MIGLFAFQAFHEDACHELALVEGILANGGELRVPFGCHDGVVEADYRHIVGNVQSFEFEHVNGGTRHEVGGDEYGVDGLAALRQELADLRDEQRIASATIASGTSKTARILERVTPDGDALAVRTAA